MATNTKTKAASTKPASRTRKRLERNFPLAFPRQFTVESLYNRLHGKVPRITLYVRIKKALAKRAIKKVGLETPSTVRQGRRQILFALAKRAKQRANRSVSPVIHRTPRARTMPKMGVRVVAGVNVNARGEPLAA